MLWHQINTEINVMEKRHASLYGHYLFYYNLFYDILRNHPEKQLNMLFLGFLVPPFTEIQATNYAWSDLRSKL